MIAFLKKNLRKIYDSNNAFIKVLRKQGAQVGNNVQIIDKNKFLYEPWCANLLEFHDNVVIAAGARLVSHDSSYANVCGDVPTRYGKIILERNVYIGVNSIILPGVIIGEYSLIGAGTIVNRSIPPRSVVVGNPCKVIGNIDEGLAKYKANVTNNTSELVHYLDLGGSYRQIVEKYGNDANNKIIDIYNDYFFNA